IPCSSASSHCRDRCPAPAGRTLPPAPCVSAGRPVAPSGTAGRACLPSWLSTAWPWLAPRPPLCSGAAWYRYCPAPTRPAGRRRRCCPASSWPCSGPRPSCPHPPVRPRASTSFRGLSDLPPPLAAKPPPPCRTFAHRCKCPPRAGSRATLGRRPCQSASGTSQSPAPPYSARDRPHPIAAASLQILRILLARLVDRGQRFLILALPLLDVRNLHQRRRIFGVSLRQFLIRLQRFVVL